MKSNCPTTQISQSSNSQAVFAKLRDSLAYLYSSKTSSRRIAYDAGLDIRRIYFSTQALDNWHAILAEAVRADKLDDLLNVALTEYGVNSDLLAACDIYHRFVEQGGRIIAPPNPAKDNIVTTVIQQIFSPTDDQWLRHRREMLSRVKTYWIEGVLEKSLYGAILVDLGLEYKPEAVNCPWEMIVQRVEQSDRQPLPGTKISDVFDEQNSELLILGAPGSGKTTMLLDLARTLIARAGQDGTHPIPVVFNLSSWAQQRQPLSDWLVDELNVRYHVPKRFGRTWLQHDQILPLLDDLDEVPRDHQEGCVEAINRFRSEYGLSNMVICSRLVDYEDLPTKLRLQGAVVLQPLTPRQINDYLVSLGDQVIGVRSVLQDDVELQELAQSPLMLSILILTYRGKLAQEIPSATLVREWRTDLFAAYVERMFGRRGYERRFTPQQTIRWLSWLGQRMAENSQSAFFLEQLQPGWLTARQERLIYMLTSRLLAGCLLGIIVSVGFATEVSNQGGDAELVLLSAVIAWLGSAIGGAVDGLIEFRRYESMPRSNSPPVSSFHRTVGLVLKKAMSITVGVSFGLGVPIVALTIVDRLLRSGRVVWSLSQAVQQLPFILVAAVFSAVVLGPIFGLRARTRTQSNDIQTIEAFQFSKRGALTGTLVGALIGSSFALPMQNESSWIIQEWLLNYMLRYCTLGGLIGGLAGKKVEISYRPNQGILRTTQKAIALGFAAIIIFGLLGATTGDPIRNLWRGTIIGLLLFMWYGGFDVAQHYTLRILLVHSG